MNNLLGDVAPTFDEPLAMLRACHERILSQCRTLEKLQTHLPQHGCDAQAQQAAQAILRYFDVAGRHHHDDEEQDLFPVLVRTAHAEALQLVARLQAEHHNMEAAWQALRPQLQAIAAGTSTLLNPQDAQHFMRAYREHIAVENPQLLPLAEQLLTAQQLESIGQRMAQRRGVPAAT